MKDLFNTALRREPYTTLVVRCKGSTPELLTIRNQSFQDNLALLKEKNYSVTIKPVGEVDPAIVGQLKALFDAKRCLTRSNRRHEDGGDDAAAAAVSAGAVASIFAVPVIHLCGDGHAIFEQMCPRLQSLCDPQCSP